MEKYPMKCFGLKEIAKWLNVDFQVISRCLKARDLRHLSGGDDDQRTECREHLLSRRDNSKASK